MPTEVVVLETKKENYPKTQFSDKTQFLFDEMLRVEFDSIPDRLEFKIGDVVKITGIKTYVLRYWESEFKTLKPKKSAKNQRIYKKKDIEMVFLIRKLLYRDRYSIQGACEVLKKYSCLGKSKFETRSLKIHMKKIAYSLQNIYDRLKVLEKKL